MNKLKSADPAVFESIDKELYRQQNTLEMIASENFTSSIVMEAVGSVLTNKYAEGYPGKRYYGGCEAVDIAENLARNRAKELFIAEYANVQPHSGSQANMGVYLTLLQPGDIVMGLNLSHGGHLTHGSHVNFSGKLYNFVSYGLDRKTGRVDFDQVYKISKECKPRLIICGGSAYPRYIEFEKFKEVALNIGSYLMADVAHPSGLIASGVHPSPWPFCDIITSTTHKTLRGPRGGMIMMGKDFKNPLGLKTPKGKIKMMSAILNSGVFPGSQGGPLEHVIAAKAIAFGEALKPTFTKYCEQVIKNAKLMAQCFIDKGYTVISGGTENHCMLIDLRNKNITGKDAENALVLADITANKNMVPFDTQSPFITSGIRLGTPAITTRGVKEDTIPYIVDLIDKIIMNYENEVVISEVKDAVNQLMSKYPIFA